ncbi:GNAT family N-acetyltransferase [Actinosynnema sp. ALI-1.44]|uniref:GNAT family N-acetyltransferase n=1 Tax=Actinosynnema sp. ALI-1.44 TaxID=1933779 RepID=UPI001177ED90|nr:GNAT family N-acetyltransferase [Actinosynnema sp. ALI-1.44]
MTSNVSISRALPEDLDTVLDILDDAAKWLQERGIEQWPSSFSQDATWRTQRIRSYIEHGLTYLVRLGEASGPVATFTLSKAADPQFAHGWPDGPESGGYIFRIAVLRHAAGQDLGGVILDWAADEVARWGKLWLRIDVHRRNPRLHQYYERHGFQKVAEVTAPDLSVPGRTRGSGTLMQRPTRLTGKGSAMNVSSYDPDGTAALWLEASNLVASMKLENPPISDDAWNVALDQAARMLERHALEIKQANGMYFRTLSGES